MRNDTWRSMIAASAAARRATERGMTLIEILVVLTLIGIIMGIIPPIMFPIPPVIPRPLVVEVCIGNLLVRSCYSAFPAPTSAPGISRTLATSEPPRQEELVRCSI